MLDHIEIDGFKSIRHLDLDMRPVNLLIGANGAGKTNFLSFFKLVNNIYNQRLQNYTMQETPERLCHYGVKQTELIRGRLSVSDSHDFAGSFYFTLQNNSGGSMFLISEGFESDCCVHFKGTTSMESSLKDFKDPEWGPLQTHLESYRVYHFNDTGKGSPLRTPSKVNDNRFLRPNGDNLPSYLFYIQQQYPKAFKRIEMTVKSILPVFESFQLAPTRLDGKEIPIEWRDANVPDKYFDSDDLSDGTLRFIALAALFLQPDPPKVIIVDEPELGLHPTAVNMLAGMVRSAARCGSQIIISTQSVELVNNLEPEAVVTVDIKDGQSVFSRLNSDDLREWLETKSIGDLWTQSIINGQPFTL